MKRGKFRKAVFIVIYSKHNGKVEYLILRRKHHWKGWEFSKGGVKFPEFKRCTARREAKEESGLKIKRIKKFNYSGRYKYPKKYPDRKGFMGQTFSLYAAEVKKGKVKVDRKEHSGFKWMGFNEAMKKLKWENQKKSLNIVNFWLKTQ